MLEDIAIHWPYLSAGLWVLVWVQRHWCSSWCLNSYRQAMVLGPLHVHSGDLVEWDLPTSWPVHPCFQLVCHLQWACYCQYADDWARLLCSAFSRVQRITSNGVHCNLVCWWLASQFFSSQESYIWHEADLFVVYLFLSLLHWQTCTIWNILLWQLQILLHLAYLLIVIIIICFNGIKCIWHYRTQKSPKGKYHTALNSALHSCVCQLTGWPLVTLWGCQASFGCH